MPTSLRPPPALALSISRCRAGEMMLRTCRNAAAGATVDEAGAAAVAGRLGGETGLRVRLSLCGDTARLCAGVAGLDMPRSSKSSRRVTALAAPRAFAATLC